MDDELLELKIVRIGRVYQGVSADLVRQWVAERRIASDDLVRPVGSERWMKVSLAPELYHSDSAGLAAAKPAARPAAGSAATTKAASRPVASTSEDLGIELPSKTQLRRRKREIEDSEMDMTPMIDVTFQLLIFFMLANQLTNSAPIEVPSAKYGKGITPDDKQAILIDQDGRYYLGDSGKEDSIEPSLDSLVAVVRENASGAQQPLEVIISAHKDARHAPLRELMWRLRDVPNLGPLHLGVEEQQ